MQAPPYFESKLPHAGTTIFTVISQAAHEHGAINLGQGFPDYPMSEDLVELVNNAMREGFNQYTHMFGYPPLRQTLAEQIHQRYGLQADADKHITITPGGTYALFTVLMALLGQQDEAIFFEPAYDCYLPQITLAGARPVALPLQSSGFGIDWQMVRDHITGRTKVIIINTPHNPTGTVLTAVDMQALEDIVQAHPQITIVSDEVYEHLVFNGASHCSVLQSPLLQQRSAACYSFGKTYNCTGWKLGYVVAPEWLTREFRKVHQFNAFSCFTPTQVALSHFAASPQNHATLGADLQDRQQYFQTALQDLPLQPLPVFGSYFQLYRYSDISSLGEFDFCMQMIQEAGVAAIPVSSFYHKPNNQGLIRFCFAKKKETLQTAASRLQQWFQKI